MFKIDKVLSTLKYLFSLWMIEVVIATLLYLPYAVYKSEIDGKLKYIITLNIFRLIYYYWALFLIYLKFDFSKPSSKAVINLIVFIFISIFLSLLITDAYQLFLEYSFFCNSISIILAPYIFIEVLKMGEN
jgi:hypothetical protein